MFIEILFYLALYACICMAGGLVMRLLYKRGIVTSLPAPKWRWLYYLLSFTWGLTMNVIGAIVALVLLCLGKKPKKYGWNVCFELPVDFGLSLGIFFIAPINGSTRTKSHEVGHSVQNVYFGPFALGTVYIPSATRFWFLQLMYAICGEQSTEYDAVWFEGQATKSGTDFINREERD